MRPLAATSLALVLSLGAAGVVVPVASQAQVGFGVSVSVGAPPPPLPYYEQPPAPGYGYIWTPGYWAWSDYDNDYYWVPGTWVLPPRIGFLWTPPWWGWNDGAYAFNAGYWGPTVGFYGGINYGFGYTGYDYEGGEWRGREFYYNKTVNNINNIHITNVYNRPINTINNFNRVSFNGPGGVRARPTSQQLYASRAPHLAPTPVQMQHLQAARTQPDLRASVNHGAPPIAATVRPALLRGPGVVPAARAGGPYTAQAGAYRPPAAARFSQAPASATERSNGGGYNGAYRQPAPRYGQAQPSASERYNGGYNGAYRPPVNANAAYRPQPGYDTGYHPPPRPPEAFSGGGGFRQPAAPAMRAPPPPMVQTRPAPQAPQGQPDRNRHDQQPH